MCLAIPAEVLELREDSMIYCRVGTSNTFLEVSSMLLPQAPVVGSFVIIHAGFAIHILSTEEAQESLRLIREMAEATYGGSAGF